jgi:hypothetical protein
MKGKKRQAKRYYFKDGVPCWICELPIPAFIASVRHPLYGTIDHMVPFTAGGTDASANRAPSHYCCNQIKSARALTPALRQQCFYAAVAAFSRTGKSPGKRAFQEAKMRVAQQLGPDAAREFLHASRALLHSALHGATHP